MWTVLILTGCNGAAGAGHEAATSGSTSSTGNSGASGSATGISSGSGSAGSTGASAQSGAIPSAEAAPPDDLGDSEALPACPNENDSSVVQSCTGVPDMCPCATDCPDGGTPGVLGECSSGTCVSKFCSATSVTSPEGGDSTDCATASYLLCDDFEKAAPGATGSKFTMDTKGGYVVETVTTQSHSGTHSIHVNSPGGSGLGYIVETATFTPAITDFWGRAYLRFMANGSGHEVFVAMDNTTSDSSGEQVRMFNDMGDGKIATNLRSTDQEKESSQAIPMGQWFCFEWHETPTELRIYFNGQDLTIADETWTEPNLVDLRLGFERFDTGTGGDVWIDDVAVNSTQIGCN